MNDDHMFQYNSANSLTQNENNFQIILAHTPLSQLPVNSSIWTSKLKYIKPRGCQLFAQQMYIYCN